MTVFRPTAIFYLLFEYVPLLLFDLAYIHSLFFKVLIDLRIEIIIYNWGKPNGEVWKTVLYGVTVVGYNLAAL